MAETDTRAFQPSALLRSLDYALSAALGIATLWTVLRDGDWPIAILLFAMAGVLIYKQLRLTRQPYAVVDSQGLSLPRRPGASYRWDAIRAVYPGRLWLQVQVAHGPLVPIGLLGVRASERQEFVRLVEARAVAAQRSRPSA